MPKLPKLIHESWHPFLQPLFDEDFSVKLLNNQILPNCNYYPEAQNIFRVFSMPMDQIRVVILGQDPYPNKDQAIGLSFAVNQNCPMPKSLTIIANEVMMEYSDTGQFYNDLLLLQKSEWRTLQHWVDQGVFLLNAALTVEEKKIGSHMQLWQMFVWRVVGIIAKEVSPIWLLWGKKAQEVTSIIRGRENNRGDNIILNAPHPAAEAYAGGKAGFYGCNHFKIVNHLLEEKNKTIIQW